jgi:hypothetical protein
MIWNIPSPVIMTLAMALLVVGVGVASLIYFHYEDKHEMNITNN